MTGFRVAYNCAQGYYNITPDLTCLGKVIGGGLPVGAYGGKAEIMERVAPSGPIYQAGTLSGNPLAMTAGYETLTQLTPQSYDEFIRKADRLEEGLMAAAEKYDVPFTVNRAGSMIGFFFTNEQVINYETAKTSNLDYFAAYYREMANEGVFYLLLNSKECFYQLLIQMQTLNIQLQQLKKLFKVAWINS